MELLRHRACSNKRRSKAIERVGETRRYEKNEYYIGKKRATKDLMREIREEKERVDCG